MPPKASSAPRWRNTITTARKSVPQATKSVGANCSPPPSNSDTAESSMKTVPADCELSSSTNSKICEPLEQSLISETSTRQIIGEESLVKLSSPDDEADTMGIEATTAGEQKVGKKKVVKKTVRIVKKIVKKKKKVPKSEKEAILDSLGVEKANSIEPKIEIVKPCSAVSVGALRIGNEVEKGAMVAESNLAIKDHEVDEPPSLESKFGIKDPEVEEPPSLERKDINDNIASLETPNVVLNSEKGTRRSVKIVKKIVKKKVPKLATGNSRKNDKGSKIGDAEDTLDSVGVEKWNFKPPETENLEPCNDVSAEGEDSKNHSLHLMDVEKATSVSDSGPTANASELPILKFKDTNVVENDNMDSLETQLVVLDSEKDNLDGNVDSTKDHNFGQFREEHYSQNREEETKEPALNEGIILSGEMEALERKRKRRTEIFIGGLDKETKEGDIRRIFEEVGEVVDVTLVINRETGKNKGFAFLRYASAASAKKAVERYSKVEISGKQCGVSLVEGNDTIYLGNIDKKWKTEDVIDLLKKAGIENIDKVTVVANPNNIEQNRGFAFVELETSKEAQIAFNKLQRKDVFGKHTKVKVAWAQPLIEPNEEEMLKVKSVYAEYLPSSWNEEQVRDYFGKFGEIESIALSKDLPSSKRKDFAFVNYTGRESALACIKAFSHEAVNSSGSKVNVKVSLAKPMSKSKQTKRATIPSKREPREEKKIQNQFTATLKKHEPNKKVNYMRRYNEGHRVDGGSSTTNELLHLLRQQVSSGQIHSGLRIGSGIDHQYSVSGNERPFSAVVDNPRHISSGGISRVQLENSFPTASQSMWSHSRGSLGTPSFAYYRQLGGGHSSGSVYGVEGLPSSFQSQERGPYGGYRGIYRRY